MDTAGAGVDAGPERPGIWAESRWSQRMNHGAHVLDRGNTRAKVLRQEHSYSQADLAGVSTWKNGGQ